MNRIRLRGRDDAFFPRGDRVSHGCERRWPWGVDQARRHAVSSSWRPSGRHPDCGTFLCAMRRRVQPKAIHGAGRRWTLCAIAVLRSCGTPQSWCRRDGLRRRQGDCLMRGGCRGATLGGESGTVRVQVGVCHYRVGRQVFRQAEEVQTRTWQCRWGHEFPLATPRGRSPEPLHRLTSVIEWRLGGIGGIAATINAGQFRRERSCDAHRSVSRS